MTSDLSLKFCRNCFVIRRLGIPTIPTLASVKRGYLFPELRCQVWKALKVEGWVGVEKKERKGEEEVEGCQEGGG